MTVSEEFSIEEQKNGLYEVTYNSTETDVKPAKILQMSEQLERLVGESKVGLQEFKPHIVSIRKQELQRNANLLTKRLEEVTKTEGVPEFVVKEQAAKIKKQIDQRSFEMNILKPENLEMRKEMITKEIEARELRLKQIRPHMDKVRLKLRKEEEKRKRMSKEAKKGEQSAVQT